MVGSVNAPEPGFRPGARWGWCHGGVLQSVGRSEALPSMPALPGRGLRTRQFPIVVRSGERPRRQHPRAFEGQGHMAIRGRRSGVPSAHGQTVGHAPNARHRSRRRLISDCNGRDPRTGARPRYGVSALLWCRAPGSGRFSRRDAAVRAVLCVGADCATPSRRRPPGFWVVLQENGPEFDALPGFWAV